MEQNPDITNTFSRSLGTLVYRGSTVVQKWKERDEIKKVANFETTIFETEFEKLRRLVIMCFGNYGVSGKSPLLVLQAHPRKPRGWGNWGETKLTR